METKIVDKNREFNPGDDLILISDHRTPGRNFNFPISKDYKITVESVFVEKTGEVHINAGYVLPNGEPPLSSLDTSMPLDDSRTYWMHPSRFKRA